MEIIIFTQDMENYGAHTWNGEGECPQRWKYKGGSTYVIRNVDADATVDPLFLLRVENFMDTLRESNEYYRVIPLGYEIVDDYKASVDSWEREMAFYVTVDDNYMFHVRKRSQYGLVYRVTGYSVDSTGKESMFFSNAFPLKHLSDGTTVFA